MISHWLIEFDLFSRNIQRDFDGAGAIIQANSSPHDATYMRQRIGSALVQIMACRIFGAKPLSIPLLWYCHLDSQEQSSVK